MYFAAVFFPTIDEALLRWPILRPKCTACTMSVRSSTCPFLGKFYAECNLGIGGNVVPNGVIVGIHRIWTLIWVQTKAVVVFWLHGAPSEPRLRNYNLNVLCCEVPAPSGGETTIDPLMISFSCCAHVSTKMHSLPLRPQPLSIGLVYRLQSFVFLLQCLKLAACRTLGRLKRKRGNHAYHQQTTRPVVCSNRYCRLENTSPYQAASFCC